MRSSSEHADHQTGDLRLANSIPGKTTANNREALRGKVLEINRFARIGVSPCCRCSRSLLSKNFPKKGSPGSPRGTSGCASCRSGLRRPVRPWCRRRGLAGTPAPALSGRVPRAKPARWGSASAASFLPAGLFSCVGIASRSCSRRPVQHTNHPTNSHQRGHEGRDRGPLDRCLQGSDETALPTSDNAPHPPDTWPVADHARQRPGRSDPVSVGAAPHSRLLVCSGG